MKKILLIFLFLISLVSCNETNFIDNTEYKSCLKEEISYKVSNELIKNPGEGFYKPYHIKLTDKVETNVTWLNNEELYHIRCGLAYYNKDSNIEDISLNALNSLDSFLTERENYKSRIIIRFAYDDFQGNANKEPDIEIIQNHIKSLSNVLNKHKNIIVALECGLIGPWGEMHTSSKSTQETYNILLEEWLNNTSDIYVLARKPKFIYEYMGYTIDNLDSFTFKEEKYKRLGVFNDGYLGTSSDTGTFVDREKEVNFLSKLYAPYGGEVINPVSSLTSIPEVIFNEQYKTHLSYLNMEWNDSIVNKWKTETFNYSLYKGYNKYNLMNNFMGYGLTLTNFKASINDNDLKLEITLSNLGFKKYDNTLKAKLIVLNNDNSYSYDININNLSITKNISIDSGEYKIYLTLNSLNNSYKLLNNTFDKEINSNYIGKIVI